MQRICTGLSLCLLSVWGTARADTTELITRAVPGSSAAGESATTRFSLSADGNTVAFRSTAGLVASDTNGKTDVYVRNLSTGVTTLVSVTPDGTAGANNDSSNPSLSADGTTVAFESRASNLVANDTNGEADIFVRNLSTGVTILESVAPDGTTGADSGSFAPSLSADGTTVAFESRASNLVANDNNSNTDIFVRNLSTGVTTLASVTPDGTAGADSLSFGPSLSANGTRVAFQSLASNLVANDTNNNYDIFVRNLSTNTTTLVSVAPDGTTGANNFSFTPSLSADGTRVAFESGASNLVANDSNGQPDIFVRNLSTGVTTLVNVAADGTTGANNDSLSASLSADGLKVAFSSNASNLVANDTNNNRYDIFVRNLSTNTTTLASVSSSGTTGADSGSFNSSLSADGTRVAFESDASNLVANNNNDNVDVFVRDLAASSTTLVTRVVPGSSATGNSFTSRFSFSADGTMVAFQSFASNLVASDPNGQTPDIFVRNLRTGVTTLASVPISGTAGANGNSFAPSLSADGTMVAFQSFASNLVASDPNGQTPDIFVRNLRTNTTTLVSVPISGTAGANEGSFASSLSADGTRVAFYSDASNLVATDTNGQTSDIFVRNLSTNTTTLVSVPISGTTGANNASLSPSLNADGTRVAFESSASNLVASDPNGQTPDIFVRNLSTGVTTLASVAPDGTTGGNDDSYNPSLSADGLKVAFESNASNLVASDNNGRSDIFVRDLSAGVTIAVSVTPDGTTTGNGNSYEARLSANGDVVAFRSEATNFIARGTSGYQVFARDLSAGARAATATKLVSVAPDNTTVGNDDSRTPSLSGNGGLVAFSSDASNLAPLDLNNSTDVFVRDISFAPFVSTPLPDVSVLEDAANTNINLRLFFSDGEDGGDLSYTVATNSNPSLVAPTINNATDVLTLDYLADAFGTATITITATDASGASVQDTFTVTIAPVNDPPVNTVPLAQSTDEDTPLVFIGTGRVLSVADVDNTSLSVTLSVSNGTLSLTGTAGLSFTVGDGADDATMTFSGSTSDINTALATTVGGTPVGLRFTPTADFNGAATLTIRSSDDALSDTDTISITVTPVNDAPTVVNQTRGTDEDTPLAITFTASDVDSPSFTFEIVTPPSNGTLSGSGATRTYTPRLNFVGLDSFTFRANDGTANSNEATVSITVGGQNDAPVAVDDTASTSEDVPLSIQVLANDTDDENDPLTVKSVAVTSATNGTLSISADKKSVLFTPALNFSGTGTFTYVANDGALDSNAATVTVQVLAANDAPVAAADSYNVSPFAPRTLQVLAPGVLANDSDAEGATLQAALVDSPRSGKLTLNANGSFSYTPGAVFSGTDSFTYVAFDGQAYSTPVTVALSVPTPRDTTPPLVSLAGAAVRRLPLLPLGRGSAVDPYATRERGIVPSSGLRPVVLRLQNGQGLFWNGRSFQVAPFDLRTRLIERSFFAMDAALPPRKPASSPDERFIYTAIATDKAGNKSTTRQFIFVDTTPPGLAITTPGAGINNTVRVSRLTSIGGRASSAAKVEVSLRNSAGLFFDGTSFVARPVFLRASLSGVNYTLSLPASLNLAPGSYLISVRALDEVANIASASRTVIVLSSPSR